MGVTVRSAVTEFGEVSVAVRGGAVVGCQFMPAERLGERFGGGRDEASEVVLADTAIAEVVGFLAGEVREFSVPFRLGVSEFDNRVLTALTERVGYGTTVSYGWLARELELPITASRAVGKALAGNPVLVIVPCHRVVGSSGALTGYAGGLEVKRGLLDLESTPDSGDLRLF
ncbi:methylated-DNA-[protein]-cysteine S-methyltransferase [Actinokineospora globicatena]|nr:methylated-DNA-[protein]-cysteine S-methyltransferase [Actinokineospora globicatena]GLW80240.1 methylated-DNA--protein-cysteine methyltransferase [Actinokineospora globicatena]GLW87069.1 methylated-DNA--protein-cysteine methyltransferase [Actinokineospora globicatena]